MKRNEEKTRENNGSLRRQGKRMLAVLMSVLLLLGVMPQYVPAAAKGGQRSAETTAAIAPSTVSSLIQPASIAMTQKLSVITPSTSAGGESGYSYRLGIRPESGGTVIKDWNKDTKILKLTAVPNPGYQFLYWTEYCIDSGSGEELECLIEDSNPRLKTLSYKVIKNSPRAVIANFKKSGEYFIWNDSMFSGKGTLEVLTPGDSFAPGTTITVEATPKKGYKLYDIQMGVAVQDGIYGSDGVEYQTISTSSTGTFTMPEGDVWICARFFSTAQHTVALSSDANGSLTFEDGSTTKKFVAGDTVKLKVAPNQGYRLDRISGVGEDFSFGDYTFTMYDQDMDIYAEFAQMKQYMLEVRTTPGQAFGAWTFTLDQESALLTLTAVPNSAGGSLFIGWFDASGNLLSDDLTYSFILNQDTSLEERFEQGYQIFVMDTTIKNGTLKVYPEKELYRAGETVRLIGVPDEGYIVKTYRIGEVSEGSVILEPITGDSFVVPKNSMGVSVVFVRQYSVTAKANETAVGEVTGSGAYEEGERVILTAAPKEGYEFVNWTENGTEVSSNATYLFAASADRDLVANFKKIKEYTITAQANDTTFGSVSGAGSFKEGTQVTLKATPAEDYIFVNWTENGTEVSNNATYMFVAEKERDLVANFKKNEGCKIIARVEDEICGSAIGSGIYEYVPLAWAKVEAFANIGYVFLYWTENGTIANTDRIYSFTLEKDRDLVAHFESVEVCKIFTEQDLRDFATRVNNGETKLSALLMADITIEDKSNLSIGNIDHPYVGVFDGQGHKIKGLCWNDENVKIEIAYGGSYHQVSAGLFGQIGSGGTVRNLTLEDLCVEFDAIDGKVNSVRIGGIASDIREGIIENCHVVNNTPIRVSGVSETNILIGGIFGFASESKISHCSFTGDGEITCSGWCAYVGGIAGYIDSSWSIMQYCFHDSTGAISVNCNDWCAVGGVAGKCSTSEVRNCYNVGDIIACGGKSWSSAGGVVGVLESWSSEFSDNYSIGIVIGDNSDVSDVGGVAGSTLRNITDCYYSIDKCPSVPAVGGIYREASITNTKGLTTEEFASLMDTSGYDPDVWEQGEIAPVLKEFRCAVTFYANDGTDRQEERIYAYRSLVSQFQNPFTREHYSFIGWNTATDGSGKSYTSEDRFEGDIVLYAQWKGDEYTINFVNEDGAELQSGKVAYGETPSYNGKAPEKEATAQYTYTFAGWDKTIATVTGDATYTATYTSTVNEYTIKFVNDDGTVLQSGKVAYGETPSYNGKTPEKEATAQYTYTFAGWDKTITSVNGDATYTATFTSTVNEYMIKFVNENGTELQSGKVAYGETPSYSGKTPEKEATAQYTYTFAGWKEEIVSVTGEATYTATYTSTVNDYTISFVNEDGTELQSGKVAYGETPIYSGETPEKEATAQYTYTFAGWDAEIATVTADATYTATYTSTVNEYTITFVNEEGTILQSGKVAYGETPIYSGETPEKEATAQYTYTFAGWDAEIATVTADATYTATYTSTVNEYTITFVNSDGTELQSGKVPYGDLPEYTGETPMQPDSAQYTLIFAGWDTGIVPVTGEAKYTATFDTTVNEYTITFVNEDGTVLQSGKLAYGETPSYKGETPAKDKTAQYTYTFAGWDREIHSVVGDLTYTATFDAAVNEYKVSFQTNGGSDVAEVTAKYGDTLATVGEPTKQGYDFDGWFIDEACTKAADLTVPITGDTTFYAKWEQVFYTATFNTSGWKEEDGTDFVVTVKRNRLDQKTFGAAKGFYMNGDPINKENILTERGSLILTLKKEYLKTLPEGENELKVEFEDGSVTTKIKVTKKHDQPAAVKTGDTTPKGLWITLAIALVGMAATFMVGAPLVGTSKKNTKTKIKPRRKVR